MQTIVTIGGGNMREHSTKKIDQEIIRLSGKKHPKLLFIPTASSDDRSYWEVMNKNFTSLGCITDVLFLLAVKITKKEIETKIMGVDIIYVGGGNTLKMMRLWRRLGVDRMLAAAYKKGIVLCGVSAGSICWFEYGHSDSMSYYNPGDWSYIKVKGLGFLKGVHCPHFDSATRGVKRRQSFQDMMQKYPAQMGIAVDDNCAIIFADNGYRVITSKDSANGYRVFKDNGRVQVQMVEKAKGFRPVSELYEK